MLLAEWLDRLPTSDPAAADPAGKGDVTAAGVLGAMLRDRRWARHTVVLDQPSLVSVWRHGSAASKVAPASAASEEALGAQPTEPTEPTAGAIVVCLSLLLPPPYMVTSELTLCSTPRAARPTRSVLSSSFFTARHRPQRPLRHRSLCHKLSGVCAVRRCFCAADSTAGDRGDSTRLVAAHPVHTSPSRPILPPECT